MSYNLDARMLWVLRIALGAALFLPEIAWAQGSGVNVNTIKIDEAVNALFTYLEGSFGALIMVCAGLGAIISSAFGQYRASLGLLVVALGAFILRSLVATFFNTDNIQP